MTTTPTILGSQVNRPIAAGELECLGLATSAPVDVSIEADNVGAVCPVTGQPDTYHLTIAYTATVKVIESKALKLWLWSFRDRPRSCEDLAAEVADVLSRRLETPVTVTAEQATRGGLRITATAGRTPP
jgi:7-cyano-7-deazaguanine reductase